MAETEPETETDPEPETDTETEPEPETETKPETETEPEQETEAELCTLCTGKLESIAYGPCLHRTVCSTCAIRVRCIGRNFNCVICRTPIEFLFVREAYGDLTSRKNDLPNFPSNPNEGRHKGLWHGDHVPTSSSKRKKGKARDLWFDKESKAFFVSFDECERMKALRRPKCTYCGKKNLKCIGNLMIHLFKDHRLYMCTVCLRCRVKFPSEQMLFNREELIKHIRNGKSKVDASSGEMSSFKGHPTCESCVNPFYGDKEVFIHLPSFICPCHLCDALIPGLNSIYLEDHFLQTVHIRRGDDYWKSSFSFPRAFEAEKYLKDHKKKKSITSVLHRLNTGGAAGKKCEKLDAAKTILAPTRIYNYLH